MLRPVLLAGALLLAGCAVAVPPDVAQLRPGQLGRDGDPDTTALDLAQYAFADSSRTYGRPADAARAAAALDYLAGAFIARPSNISAETQADLLQSRQELRAALAVAPGAPSQAVVDRLTAAAGALSANDEAGALRQLGPPVFTVPPGQVLARLSNLPYLRVANVATARAANEMLAPDNPNGL